MSSDFNSRISLHEETSLKDGDCVDGLQKVLEYFTILPGLKLIFWAFHPHYDPDWPTDYFRIELIDAEQKIVDLQVKEENGENGKWVKNYLTSHQANLSTFFTQCGYTIAE